MVRKNCASQIIPAVRYLRALRYFIFYKIYPHSYQNFCQIFCHIAIKFVTNNYYPKYTGPYGNIMFVTHAFIHYFISNNDYKRLINSISKFKIQKVSRD